MSRDYASDKLSRSPLYANQIQSGHPRPDNIEDMQREMPEVFRSKHGSGSGTIDIVCNQNRDWGSLETRQPATAISK